jgi:hypothetical protein
MRYYFCLLLLVIACFYCKRKPRVAQNKPSSSLADADISGNTQLLNDLYALSADSMEGRETATLGGEKAADYLKKRMSAYHLLAMERSANRGALLLLEVFDTVNIDLYKQDFQFSTTKGTNLHGLIGGTQHSEKYMVVSAHYDHLGIKNGKIYNGADDNASGVAVLLALMAYLQKNPPKHSVIFCFFDAEEKGLNGSKAWVLNPPIPLKNIAFNLNLDMVSRSDKQELFFSGTYHHPVYKDWLMPLQVKTSVKMMFGHDRPEDGTDDWTNQSDHYSFHAAKIPYLYLGVEDHTDYHRDTDEADKIDKAFFVDVNGLIREVFSVFDEKIAF